MGLAFQILGRFQALRDGDPLRLPAGRPSALLLTLLVQDNRVVPTDRLVDELWDGRPPTSAVANLRSHASQLRAALGEPDRLVGTAGGYLLRVGEGELDATRFELLATHGEVALAAGDPTTAGRLLDHALALWAPAPPPLPAAGPLLTAALDRMRERRICATEAAFACRLARGVDDGADLVDRLRRHLTENPLRERAWAQLMLARYRMGDPAGALETFAEARAILAADLGVCPGAELARLHRAVLRRDPALLPPRPEPSAPPSAGRAARPGPAAGGTRAASAPGRPIGAAPGLGAPDPVTDRTSGPPGPAGTPDPAGPAGRPCPARQAGTPDPPDPVGLPCPAGAPGPPEPAAGPLGLPDAPGPPGPGGTVPHELPRQPGMFRGRTEELRRVRAALTAGSGHPVAVNIHGAPGVGKSALAGRVASACLDAFPDGQVHLDLGGSDTPYDPDPAEVTGRLLRSLGDPARPVPGGDAEARARVRSLLFGRRVLLLLDNVGTEAQVAGLLPARGGCGMLTTSRARLGTPDGVRLRLGPLPAQAAAALLRAAVRPRRLDDRTAAAVAGLCEGLPAALRVVGDRMAQPQRSVAGAVARFADERHRLDESGLRPRFAASYRRLGPAATAFRQLGLVRLHHVGPDAAAALLDVDREAASAALDHLADAHLLEPVGVGRFGLSPLLWLYAAELAVEEPAETRAAAVRRVLAAYLAGAIRAARLLGLPLDREAATWRAAGTDPGPRFRCPAEAAAWLDGERDNLAGLIRQAAILADTAGYADRLRRLLPSRPRRRDEHRRAADPGALALAAARMPGEPHGTAVA
ncbi:BTAD domain-containing putative transcriptional regulator [Plantactinospora siamensis]|uniref:BTAD domain-containing putative transcriptional regulator n=1 Tax=Plantactinospora siamensis TaxID=555372 RepID=A0ABV6P1C3_9ACTN